MVFKDNWFRETPSNNKNAEENGLSHIYTIGEANPVQNSEKSILTKERFFDDKGKKGFQRSRIAKDRVISRNVNFFGPARDYCNEG